MDEKKEGFKIEQEHKNLLKEFKKPKNSFRCI